MPFASRLMRARCHGAHGLATGCRRPARFRFDAPRIAGPRARWHHSRMRRISLVIPAVLLALASLSGCPPAPLQSRAVRVQSRAELIGGPRALGEVGDWLIENDKVRFIIQDEGFSRGFGVFGGALLDADLVRPEEGRGDSTGGNGRDNFGEM